MGEATIYKAVEEFGDLDFIVYGGNWNAATSEAYKVAKDNNIALFNYSGIMGALNLENPKEYKQSAKKKIQLSLKKELKQVDIYIFGSFLNSMKPNDIDLIVIYDSTVYKRDSIYVYCLELINQIKQKTGLPVDVTYLSTDEEIDTRFIEIVNAVSITTSFVFNIENDV